MGNYSSIMDIFDKESEEIYCNSCNFLINKPSKNSTSINMQCSECNKRTQEYYHNDCMRIHRENHLQNDFVCSKCIYSNPNETSEIIS